MTTSDSPTSSVGSTPTGGGSRSCTTVAHGTRVTREILDELDEGSIVLTRTSGWTKIGRDRWAKPMAPGYGVKERSSGWLMEVALFVAWDAGECYHRTGLFAEDQAGVR